MITTMMNQKRGLTDSVSWPDDGDLTEIRTEN